MVAVTADIERPAAATLGNELEAARLQGRARRIVLVLDALARRVSEIEASGRRPPRPLSLARRDFRKELEGIERRLAELEHARAAHPPR